MNLSEKIYKLRKEKGFSQDELAAMLDVSRQSISKWENNSAVPELDKLVRMSEIFGISLDELVKGEAAAMEQEKNVVYPPQNNTDKRKIIGTILLCTSAVIFLLTTVLFGVWGGLIFASPFLICGIICFIFKKNIGLWCGWAVYFCVDLYLQIATGTSRGVVFNLQYYKYVGNPIRIVIAWALMGTLILLIVITIFRFIKNEIVITRKKITKYILIWAAYLGIHGFEIFLSWLSAKALRSSMSYGAVRVELYFSMAVNYVMSWITVVLFTMIIIDSVKLIKAAIKKRGE